MASAALQKKAEIPLVSSFPAFHFLPPIFYTLLPLFSVIQIFSSICQKITNLASEASHVTL